MYANTTNYWFDNNDWNKGWPDGGTKGWIKFVDSITFDDVVLITDKEGDDAYYLAFSFPGVSKDGISILVNEKELKLSVVSKGDDEFGIKEFEYSYEKKFDKSIDIDSVWSEFKDGVLKIKLPFSKENKFKQIKL